MSFRSKRAMKLAEKGKYDKAQKVASRIKDMATSLDAKRKITSMQNKENPFDEFIMKPGGKTPMRNTLLNKITRK
jgi:hypothetical protein